ncbi:L10-interacting MYB domain-containing protein-like [Phragmites australis]|uniref:L10-interacting MYB domain-containing protein-like n=1 Tax=Phragmites australis TaxID=29695 RepID=UPI002D788EAA|nr:L10-interacting MYB domain-containing protein-like [Phragmites australis]
MDKKEKGVAKADWDPLVTTIFCKLAVEEIHAGNRPLGGLNARGYQSLGQKFLAQTGRNYTQKQLKNRWDNLKILYTFWKSLLNKTGLGWNAELGTVSASLEFWEETTKGQNQREKKALCFGPPNNLRELEFMFERSHVSGLSACIPGEEGIEGNTGSHINVDDDDDKDAEGMEEDLTPMMAARKQLKRKEKSSIPRKNSLKKGKNPMVRVMTRMVDDVISSNSVTSKALIGDYTRQSIREVMNLTKEAGAVEGSDEHFMATKLFVKAENREMFLTFETNEGRFNWLKRCYEERKK